MKLDKKIRFSVICDMYGNIVLSRHREGLENFLTIHFNIQLRPGEFDTSMKTRSEKENLL